MKTENLSLVPVLLIIGGELLIIFSFFTLVPGPNRDAVFYLNIAVVTSVYVVNISKFYILKGNKEQFESKIAGIGIFWFFIGIYTVLSISGMLAGAGCLLPFKIQLLYQIIFIFIFLVGLFITQSSAKFSVSVSESERSLKQGPGTLADIMTNIEMTFNSRGLTWAKEEQLISTIKDKIRFLSASTNANALQLESDFLGEAGEILDALRSANPDQQTIITKLNKCDGLLNQRKQFFIN